MPQFYELDYPTKTTQLIVYACKEEKNHEIHPWAASCIALSKLPCTWFMTQFTKTTLTISSTNSYTHIHFIILIHFIGDILHSSFIVCSINFTTPITFSFLAPTRILLYYFYIVLKRWLYIGNIAASIETKREKKTIKKSGVCVCVSLNWKLNAYKMVADSSPCRIISHSNLTIPKLNYL